jgi:hypothetical protein
MAKYYFREHEEECCYTLSGLKKMMKDFGCKQQKIFEAKRMTNFEYFYCNKYQTYDAL